MNSRAVIDRERRRLIAGLGALAFGFKFAPAGAQERVTLRFLNWSTELASTMFARFTAETGVAVSLESFPDAGTLYAKIQDTGQAPYDLIVPSDRLVTRMVLANLLQPIDPRLIPNLRNIDPAFANAAFDPGRRHSVAYLWGALGIAFRRPAFQSAPGSWKWLLDSDAHAGRIGWLADGQLMIQVALKYLGHSANTLDPSQIKDAAELLRRQRPRVARLAPGAGEELLLAREVDLVLGWNGNIARARRRDPEVEYVVPGEGTLLRQDCLCIPRRAPHPREAHALIDFLLRADVGEEIARTLLFATPNAAARAALPESYRTDPTVYPPEDVLAHSEIAAYRGERVIQIYEHAWSGVLSS